MIFLTLRKSVRSIQYPSKVLYFECILKSEENEALGRIGHILHQLDIVHLLLLCLHVAFPLSEQNLLFLASIDILQSNLNQ